MKCSIQQSCLILAVGTLLVSGCSMSRGNLASKSSAAESRAADEFDDDEPGAVKTANTESPDGDADGPPSQPGTKQSAKPRNKLTGWLRKREPKRESIPLARTDSESESEETLAEDGNDWLKFSEAPMTADSQSAKSTKSGLDGANPFEQ